MVNKLRRILENPERIRPYLKHKWRQARFSWVKRFAPHAPFVCRVPLGRLGIKVYPEDILAESLFMGDFELEVAEFLTRFLEPGMVCVDVGAHIGVFTLLAAERVGPSGQVHAFEPGPSEFEQLKGNVALNNLTNVKLNPVAITAENGYATLTVCGGGGEPSIRWASYRTRALEQRLTALL